MAELKKDNNYVSVSGGVTDDASMTVQPFRVNPATNALLVDTTVSVGTVTIGNVTLGGGTVTTLSSGTVNIASMPSVTIAGGTITTISSGTVNANVTITSLGTVTTLSSGTVNVATESIELIGTPTILGITNPINIGTGTIATVSTVGAVTTITNPVNIGTGTIATVSAVTTITNPVNIGTGTIATVSAVTTITNPISISNGTIQASITAGGSITASGMTAHDGAITGNPLRIGATAETALSGITAVADGDATNLYAGIDGVLFVRPHTGLEDIISVTSSTGGNGTVQLFAGAGAGIKQYLTDITISNSGGTMRTITFYNNTTAKYLIPAPAGGGATHAFTVPLPGTAAVAWYWAADKNDATGSINVSAVGFKSKV